MKKTLILLIITFFATVGILTAAVAVVNNYIIKNTAAKLETAELGAARLGPVIQEEAEEFDIYAYVYHTEPVFTPEPEIIAERIKPQTKMIYEYFYEADKKMETLEEEPKYFYLNMTEEELSEIHKEWDIVSFSSEEVVLRKTVAEPKGQTYVIGVLDGYIAVFYQSEGVSSVKEITSTSITALSKEEQSRLIKGIPIKGEMDLIKILEDYGS